MNEFISILKSSLRSVATQFDDIINRNDQIVNVETSNISDNIEDKIKLSEAIDELILEEKDEVTVELTDGETVVLRT